MCISAYFPRSNRQGVVRKGGGRGVKNLTLAIISKKRKKEKKIQACDYDIPGKGGGPGPHHFWTFFFWGGFSLSLIHPIISASS